jgi:hypothetical protein
MKGCGSFFEIVSNTFALKTKFYHYFICGHEIGVLMAIYMFDPIDQSILKHRKAQGSTFIFH